MSDTLTHLNTAQPSLTTSIRKFYVVALVLCSIGSFGQSKEYKPLSNPAQFKKDFASQSSQISTISSAFSQEKVLTALTEKITSTGTFKFKKDHKVRIEYQKPFSYLLVMNGDKLYVRDQDKESRMNVKSNKLFQQINRVMVDCIQGTILDSKDFTSTISESPDAYKLEMTPVVKTLKDFFKNIVVIVDKKDYAVQSIQMNEPSGDYTRMNFTDKKLNTPIPDEVFNP